jgi:sulfonate transport system ATP-binding protein
VDDTICLKINRLNKVFTLGDGEVQALKDINLEVNTGEFISIVGASGCGKSTLLRIISGLDSLTDGAITCDGAKISGPSNDCGLVFQEARLFPWLTVVENIAFGISRENRGRLSKSEQQDLVQKYLTLVNLEGFGNAYPHQLSGGMQQRVSIARALIENPKILLLDEPFGALDALTRIKMQQEFLKIWEAEKTTMILVTHDVDEAIYLGNRIVVLSSRPGTIATILKVDLARPRDRSSYDFVNLRRELYKHFFSEQEATEDYYGAYI